MMKRNVIIFKDPAKQAAETIPGSDALAGGGEDVGAQMMASHSF